MTNKFSLYLHSHAQNLNFAAPSELCCKQSNYDSINVSVLHGRRANAEIKSDYVTGMKNQNTKIPTLLDGGFLKKDGYSRRVLSCHTSFFKAFES